MNSRAANGSTPLHWAAQAGDPEVVQTLLDFGADPGARTCTWSVIATAVAAVVGGLICHGKVAGLLQQIALAVVRSSATQRQQGLCLYFSRAIDGCNHGMFNC